MGHILVLILENWTNDMLYDISFDLFQKMLSSIYFYVPQNILTILALNSYKEFKS